MALIFNEVKGSYVNSPSDQIKIEGYLSGRSTLPLRLTLFDKQQQWVAEKIVHRLGQFTVIVDLEESLKNNSVFTLKVYDRLDEIDVIESVRLG